MIATNGHGDVRLISRLDGESESDFSLRKAKAEKRERERSQRQRVDVTLQVSHPDHPLQKFARVWQ